MSSLQGKKLGVLLSTQPDQPGFRHGVRLAAARPPQDAEGRSAGIDSSRTIRRGGVQDGIGAVRALEAGGMTCLMTRWNRLGDERFDHSDVAQIVSTRRTLTVSDPFGAS